MVKDSGDRHNKNQKISIQDIIKENRHNKNYNVGIKYKNNEVMTTSDLVVEMLRLSYGGKIYKGNYNKTTSQLKYLQEITKITSYPSTQTKHDISYIIRLEFRSINIWFQNHRQSRIFKERRKEIIDDNFDIPRDILLKIFFDSK